jgi:hypothetical protein
MGKIGRWFGARDNAVIYLAFIVILLAIIGAIALAIKDTGLAPDLLKALLALALSALGFMFGAGTSHRKDGHG